MDQWNYFDHVILMVSHIGLGHWQALNLGQASPVVFTSVKTEQHWQLHSETYAVITCATMNTKYTSLKSIILHITCCIKLHADAVSMSLKQVIIPACLKYLLSVTLVSRASQVLFHLHKTLLVSSVNSSWDTIMQTLSTHFSYTCNRLIDWSFDP